MYRDVVARRGELKHLSNPRKRKKFDFVSSGERKRNSLNLIDAKLRGVVYRVSWGSIAGGSNLRRKEILFHFSRTVWKDWPKQVTALYVKK